MNDITLKFFDEEISIKTPKDLSSLKKQISEIFILSPSDTDEILISYIKDSKKTIIKTEQDFSNFISNKIAIINLDISQDSKLFLQNLKTLQKESEDKKKELEELLNKKEEIKKLKESTLKYRNMEITNLKKQIQEIKQKKKQLKKLLIDEEAQFNKDEEEINIKIIEFQEKLGLKNSQKKFKNENTIKNILDDCFKFQNKVYKKIEKIYTNTYLKINEIINPVNEKISDFENQLKIGKIELKPEENENFLYHIKFFKDFIKNIDIFNKYIQRETQKLNADIQKIEKNQKEIFYPSKNKKELMKKEIKNKNEKGVKKEEKKIDKNEIIICNGCQMFPIIGNKYKCETCPNFYFCENCFEKGKNMHKHNFKCIEQLNYLDINFIKKNIKVEEEKPKVHYRYICDGCDMDPIIGNRYTCTVCDNFDYCESCKEKFGKKHNHPFNKIDKPVPIKPGINFPRGNYKI